MEMNFTNHRYHGGWLAPNIYFLGHAGCIQVNGIRIAGASGIFKSQDFPHGMFPFLSWFYSTPTSYRPLGETSIQPRINAEHLSHPRIQYHAVISCESPNGAEPAHTTHSPTIAIAPHHLLVSRLASRYRAFRRHKWLIASKTLFQAGHQDWLIRLASDDGPSSYAQARLVVLGASPLSFRRCRDPPRGGPSNFCEWRYRGRNQPR